MKLDSKLFVKNAFYFSHFPRTLSSIITVQVVTISYSTPFPMTNLTFHSNPFCSTVSPGDISTERFPFPQFLHLVS